jgi:hypothetical protein
MLSVMLIIGTMMGFSVVKGDWGRGGARLVGGFGGKLATMPGIELTNPVGESVGAIEGLLAAIGGELAGMQLGWAEGGIAGMEELLAETGGEWAAL